MCSLALGRPNCYHFNLPYLIAMLARAYTTDIETDRTHTCAPSNLILPLPSPLRFLPMPPSFPSYHTRLPSPPLHSPPNAPHLTLLPPPPPPPVAAASRGDTAKHLIRYTLHTRGHSIFSRKQAPPALRCWRRSVQVSRQCTTPTPSGCPVPSAAGTDQEVCI